MAPRRGLEGQPRPLTQAGTRALPCTTPGLGRCRPAPVVRRTDPRVVLGREGRRLSQAVVRSQVHASRFFRAGPGAASAYQALSQRWAHTPAFTQVAVQSHRRTTD